MEYALWGYGSLLTAGIDNVLILVIVEYALWELIKKIEATPARSLNPCYSGICSVSDWQKIDAEDLNKGLNPCYSGICSVRNGKYILAEELHELS